MERAAEMNAVRNEGEGVRIVAMFIDITLEGVEQATILDRLIVSCSSSAALVSQPGI